MLDNMATSLQHALCCWSSSQQSPVDDHPSSPSSPDSPCSAHSAHTCTCDRPTVSTAASKEKAGQRSHCCYHERLARAQMYSSQRQQHQQQQQQQQQQHQQAKRSSGSLSPPRRTWPRSSHIKGVLAKKNAGMGAPSAHDVVSPYHSTTFMLTPPSAYHYDAYSSVHHHSTSPGKSPSKRVSLQKYYYGRNSMTAARAAAAIASRTPSPPPFSSSPSSPTTTSTSVPVPGLGLGSGSGSILGPALSSQPLSPSLSFAMDADVEMISAPGRPGTLSYPPLSPPSLSLSLPTKSQPTQGSDAGSSTLEHSSRQPLSLTIAPPSTTTDAHTDQDMPSQRRLSPPTLTTILATPVSPSRPSLPLSCSPPSTFTLSPPSMSYVSTSPITSSSPSSSPFSCSPTSSSTSFSSSPPSMSYLSGDAGSKISSPEESESTPYPASAMTAAKLASILQQVNQGAGVSAGSRHCPLILDMRPHPEFYPVSILQSININLPTLLMRRYRRGGPISSFALESFITMPSDKDLYHQILDSWRGASPQDLHDVVVLDQDMGSGAEEYGRSATAAWTLLNVLERGCGQGCFGGASIRVWYLEGGFDAFHAWDAGEKFLVRPGMLSSTLTSSPSSSPNLGPASTQHNDQDVEMTAAKDQPPAAVGRKPSLLAINTSVAFVPKQRTPARRESLFSLNTKSLQRPASLSRSQTVNLKPLTIPSINTQVNNCQRQQQQQPQLQQKGSSWLTVPSTSASSTPAGASALSPAMSTISNHSMEIAHSASTEHTASSCWSADSNSINGSAQFPLSTITPAGGLVSMLPLNSKPSLSSLRTMSSMHGLHSSSVSVREEDEDEFRHPSIHHLNNSQISQDFYQEYNNRMFKHSTSISEQYPTSSQYNVQRQHHLQRNRSQRDYSLSTYSSSESLQGHQQQQPDLDRFQVPLDEENFDDDGEQEISCILPGFLYLGPEIVNADQVQTLERLGVKRILNMATECEDLLVSSQQQSQFQYHKVGVYDHIEADVSAGLLEAVDIIAASKDSPIYVHCKAGKSRSVTATIAYLITQLHWPLNKAYKHVHTQRPCMCPNIGFVTELMRMEEKTLGADKAGGLHPQS